MRKIILEFLNKDNGITSIVRNAYSRFYEYEYKWLETNQKELISMRELHKEKIGQLEFKVRQLQEEKNAMAAQINEIKEYVSQSNKVLDKVVFALSENTVRTLVALENLQTK